MLDGLKSRFGFSKQSDYDDEYDDEYDAYSDNFDDYSTYDDEDDIDQQVEYSPYAPVTTRSAGVGRASHPPLVSYGEARASTPQTGSYEPLPTRSSRSSLGRNSVGRASDYALSGSEIEDAPATYEPRRFSDADASPAQGSSRRGGDSLFGSARAGDGSGRDATSSSQGGYDPYRAYEGSSSASSHHPTRNVIVISPIAYDEVENVARTLKAGDAVVLSLRNTPSQLSKRILDFSFGVASALDGSVECIADKVFAITRGKALTEDETTKLRNQGVM